MSEAAWSPNHTQLLSALISLALGETRNVPSYFQNLGYELRAIEFPLLDSQGRRFEPDLHMLCLERNCSLLVECKSGDAGINTEQLAKYLATGGVEVIQAGVSVPLPRDHFANAAFFVLPDVVQQLVDAMARVSSSEDQHWVLAEIAPDRISSKHDLLTDHALSESLAAGWEVRLDELPMGRLRFESDAREIDLADAAFQSIIGFLVAGRPEFSVDDLCLDMIPLWDYYAGKQVHLRKRIREQMSRIRRVALSKWLEVVPDASTAESRWRFLKEFSARTKSSRTLQAYHKRYLEILSEPRAPRRRDFVGLDAEQYLVPIKYDPGRFFDLIETEDQD